MKRNQSIGTVMRCNCMMNFELRKKWYISFLVFLIFFRFMFFIFLLEFGFLDIYLKLIYLGIFSCTKQVLINIYNFLLFNFMVVEKLLNCKVYCFRHFLKILIFRWQSIKFERNRLNNFCEIKIKKKVSFFKFYFLRII